MQWDADGWPGIFDHFSTSHEMVQEDDDEIDDEAFLQRQQVASNVLWKRKVRERKGVDECMDGACRNS